MHLAKQIRFEGEAAALKAALLDAFFAAAGDADGYQALHFLRPLRAERRSGGRARAVTEQLQTIGQKRLAAFIPSSPKPILRPLPYRTSRRATARQALMLSSAVEAIALQAG